jgi:serine/threonine-protein kinase
VDLVPGARLGGYEVSSLIGRGGMGEVYRAKDSKLGREVALKIVSDSFTHEAEQVARFRREAQLLATLNHPNIAAIYGLEETAGQQFLVLELVSGDTLADRLKRGPLPIAETLTIAREIARALDAAHEKGVIHRDLKPANIGLADDGTVKVLDFGLAKVFEPAVASSGDLANSPTITTPALMTGVGVLLGTAAYMSPEQARGRPADKRSDVWAFGCVMFEMLTGRRAFEGDDVSETLAAILKGEPDWSALPGNLPPVVRTLIEACLVKDRRQRIGDMSTVLFLLDHADRIAVDTARGRPRRAFLGMAAAAAAGLAFGIAVTTASRWVSSSQPAAPVTRFAIDLPAGSTLSMSRQAIDISPDGSRLVYVVDARLFVRNLSELDSRAIAGADAAVGPVFSPDGQSVVFWNAGMLKRIPVTGGTAVTICQTNPAPSGIAWDGDQILFAAPTQGIMRVAANGGSPTVIAEVKALEGFAHGPSILPGGRAMLFTLAPRTGVAVDYWDHGRIVAQSLQSGERKTLIESGADARYVPTGHLVYAQGGTLFAVPFDPVKLAVTGGPVPVIEGVRRVTSASGGGANFAFSKTGSLIYVPGPASGGQEDIVLFDRSGAGQPLKLPAASYRYPRVSRDGKRIAFETNDAKEAFIAIYDLSGASSAQRLTFGGNNRFPIWSADGKYVAFQSDREGDVAVFRQPAVGGAVQRLTHADPGTSQVPEAWSPDGEVLLYSVATPSSTSLWMLSLRDGKTTPIVDVKSSTYRTDADFSPDGRWIAYQIGEAAQGEAYTFVEPFPPNGSKYQIAHGGRPVWLRDGKEILFIPSPSRLMAVSIMTQPAFSFTTPQNLPRGFGTADPPNPRPYDVTNDGRIIGIGTAGLSQSGAPPTMQINVVLNWLEELKQRVPTR